jgi:hypothetical protein
MRFRFRLLLCRQKSWDVERASTAKGSPRLAFSTFRTYNLF